MKDTEGRMIYLDQIDDDNDSIGYKAVALAYDVQSGEARGIDETEAPADIGHYITQVREDMGDIADNLIDDVLRGDGQSEADDFMNLLVNLKNQPHELLSNLLAAIIIDCAESATSNVVDQAEQIME